MVRTMSTVAATHSDKPASATQSESQSLAQLVSAGRPLSEITAFLDGLDGAARVATCRAMPGRLQAALWKLCAGAPPVTVADMASVLVDGQELPAEEGQTVIWAGKNSLPLFTQFEKRFTRLGGAVIGYNHQSISWLTGPGYYTTVPAPDRLGEILFDYTKIPSVAPPDGWPTVQPNTRGLSFFVYRNMHDFCRRVARGVVLGEATRLGKPIDSYFLLARR